MKQNEQQYYGNETNMEEKRQIENTTIVNDKQHVIIGNMNSKNEITIADCLITNFKSNIFLMVCKFSKKQKMLSWFVKQKIFFGMICDTKSGISIFLIGLLFAILSGCSISFVVVFLGRIKHILLTNEPTTDSFLNGISKQIIILAFVIVLAIVTHFVMVILISLQQHTLS
ncbi:hypothetical protein LOAG_13643 [Loa loa]|uniref:Uncharacterized protein n=1 Tax=Loa loa TaxID=7209 RepID=A0A1S0TIZ0_LOALO|nr:hypothetical protein LOAG_13643 [Loa loa]EFO14872.1 hypothetical protein LOAG_13643 [Loa loa]